MIYFTFHENKNTNKQTYEQNDNKENNDFAAATHSVSTSPMTDSSDKC